jgi:hypothetical protein
MRESAKLKLKRPPVLRLVAALALMLSLGASQASGEARPVVGEGQATELIKSDCHELIVLGGSLPPQFLADPDLVDPLVPDRFKLAEDPLLTDENGRAMAGLVLRTSICGRLALAEGKHVIDSDPRPGLMAQFGIAIQPPDGTTADPDGYQNVDGVPCCNWYILSWVTNDRDVAAWLKEGSGLGSKARYVADLSLSYARATGGRYGFRAGDPAPSPFEVDGVAGRPVEQPQHHIAVGWWTEKDGGALKFFDEHETLTFGTSEGVVRPRAGSQMEALLGTSEARFGPDPVSSNGIALAETTKVLVPCGNQCHPPSPEPVGASGVAAFGD